MEQYNIYYSKYELQGMIRMYGEYLHFKDTLQ